MTKRTLTVKSTRKRWEENKVERWHPLGAAITGPTTPIGRRLPLSIGITTGNDA
ncbi:MAG: hypothetical protein V3W14_09075 [Candidatus Neomarinimicrobiota bacterium]